MPRCKRVTAATVLLNMFLIAFYIFLSSILSGRNHDKGRKVEIRHLLDRKKLSMISDHYPAARESLWMEYGPGNYTLVSIII